MIIMYIQFENRDTFYICGYCVETSLETCENDLSKLWRDFDIKKEELYNVFGYKNEFYGLMWHTQNQRYCYLVGIEAEKINDTPEGAVWKCVPGTYYSVAFISPTIFAVDAWTEYYEKVLPKTDYVPDTDHDINFEYYPNGKYGPYQLWTPVIKKG